MQRIHIFWNDCLVLQMLTKFKENKSQNKSQELTCTSSSFSLANWKSCCPRVILMMVLKSNTTHAVYSWCRKFIVVAPVWIGCFLRLLQPPLLTIDITCFKNHSHRFSFHVKKHTIFFLGFKTHFSHFTLDSAMISGSLATPLYALFLSWGIGRWIRCKMHSPAVMSRVIFGVLLEHCFWWDLVDGQQLGISVKWEKRGKNWK